MRSCTSCTICSTSLTGKQRLYCSTPCRSKANYLVNSADGKWRANRPKYAAAQADYHRRRRAGLTGIPTVPCAACGTDTGKVAASEPGRRRVCSTMCRTYLSYGHWPTSPVRTAPKPRAIKATRITGPYTKACGWCDTTFTTMRTVDIYCSTKCSDRVKRDRRRTREAGSYGEWRWSDFMRMARRFDYCCAYCGTKPDRLDPDHVTPLSRGGLNVINNLLPTCLHCNSDKRDLLLPEWEADRQRRNLEPRTTTWPDTDPRYWHLTATSLRHAA